MNETIAVIISAIMALNGTLAPTESKPINPVPTPTQVVRPVVKTDYSDTIKVKVTEAERLKINAQLIIMDEDFKVLAKLIYREARRSTIPTAQKAAVAWCVLNRVDDERWPNTISGVAKQPHQFAWVSRTPVTDEFYELSKDVVTRWLLEKEGYEDVGRTLPSNYCFFAGWSDHLNHFRTGYRTRDYWNWSLPDPYEGGEL